MVLKPYLHKLFNFDWDLPRPLGRVFYRSYFQKGDTKNLENYRGITLLSVVGKLFTFIFNNMLND